MKHFFACLILATTCAIAQSAAPSARTTDSSTQRPDVRELLDLMHSRQQMEVALNGMKEQFKRGQMMGLKESLRQKGITLTPEQMTKAQASLDGMADDVFKDMPYDEMVNATAEIYARHFSPDDVKAMLAFYRTPTGQKFLTEMPGIMQESMQAGGDIMKARVPELTRRADERMQQLIRDLSAAQDAPAQPSPKSSPKQ